MTHGEIDTGREAYTTTDIGADHEIVLTEDPKAILVLDDAISELVSIDRDMMVDIDLNDVDRAVALFRALARALEMEGMTVAEAQEIGEALGELDFHPESKKAARVLRQVTGE